jgi:hypothetical protein
MDETPPDEIRTAPAVARRALALFGVVAVALGADREAILDWLESENLRDELSPAEAEFMASVEPSEQQVVNASWYSERLIVLLWALGLAAVPEADQQCDTSVFLDVLPPYSGATAANVIMEATLRCPDELFAMADAIFDLHWQARDARINDREPESPVDLEIIQERHHAINWVIGYDGLAWDEVTTDT